jgi:hypothetical protein
MRFARLRQREAETTAPSSHVVALDAAFAAELEEALHGSVLPLGRRRDARTALDGSLFEQTRTIPPSRASASSSDAH